LDEEKFFLLNGFGIISPLSLKSFIVDKSSQSKTAISDVKLQNKSQRVE